MPLLFENKLQVMHQHYQLTDIVLIVVQQYSMLQCRSAWYLYCNGEAMQWSNEHLIINMINIVSSSSLSSSSLLIISSIIITHHHTFFSIHLYNSLPLLTNIYSQNRCHIYLLLYTTIFDLYLLSLLRLLCDV